MKRTIRYFIISFLSCLFVIGMGFFIAHGASAQTTSGTANTGFISANDLGVNYGAATGLGSTDIRLTIARIIRTVLGLLGIIAILIILYGGFVYMTAGGNEEKVAEAKKILINGVIGLIIILSSFSIASFVITKLVGATTGVGENGGGGGGDENSEQFLSNVFYVSSLPQAGAVCIRNIHLLVVFNKEVDLNTLSGNVAVQDVASSSAEVPGSWEYGQTNNMALFTPEGSCAPSVGNDCFKREATYNFVFKNAAGVKTLAKSPELTLNCQYRAGCGPTTFKSGLGVDRLPPTVTITYPTSDSILEPGTTIPVNLHYTDDNGVQNLALSYNKGTSSSTFINSVSFSGCKQSDDVIIPWSTSGVRPDTYTISAIATDWAGQPGSANANVILRPSQCFNDAQDTNEAGIDCGGTSGCGLCQGGSCSANSQCASGACVNGICRNVMRIDSFSPASGAPGTYVTISGYWFGEIPGKVYFATTNSPAVGNASDWKEAKVVNCGNVIDNWRNRQILVEVPVATAASSPIKVEGAAVLVDGILTKPVDITSKHSLPNFEVTTLVRPGICMLNPNSGQAGDAIVIVGKNFGVLQSASDRVLFGELKAVMAANQNNTPAWAPGQITAAVPALVASTVGVNVTHDGVPSNSVRFTVAGGAAVTAPFITDITPVQGAGGGYVTITGGNFGDTIGGVWFKATPTSGAIGGSFNFPPACQSSAWSDEKIVVKFPINSGLINASYLVQINTSDNKTSAIDLRKTFTLQAGDPAPGICAVTPLGGPIPFPTGQTVHLTGEYFLTNLPGGTTGPLPTDVYFWNGAGNPDSITGRTPADRSAPFTITTTTITVRPPDNTISGAVSVYRGNDQKISNPINFNAKDCRVNTNQCATGSHCCSGGDQAGECRSNSELCVGETRSTGYVWRFSTKDLPPVPRVVERCDATTERGLALPTPTPSIQWDSASDGRNDHHAVCSTALVTVEFSTAIDQVLVNAQNVVINRCTSVDDKNNCVNPVSQTLTTDSYTLQTAASNLQAAHDFLTLANTRPWESGIWYQVVLKNKIKSRAPTGGVSIALASDKPCSALDSAYCFVFRAGDRECVLRAVVVTPYDYLTESLEILMRHRVAAGVGRPVDYIGNGLSNQRCVMMDVRGYDWQWASGNTTYSDIVGVSTAQTANVSSKANTVGIGIPNDAVSIRATATTNTPSVNSASGASPLTIDLTHPAVVDYWPKCQEACTNADVAVQFNVSLSTKNIQGDAADARGAIARGTVQLNKCNDDNCLSVTPVGVSSDVVLDANTPFNVLHLANYTNGSTELAPNTKYQVVVSAVSSSPNAINQVWSRAQLNAANTFVRPYNQQFTWIFKTKKDKCVVVRVVVTPKEFEAQLVNDRQVYAAQPFSSPDACSADGQKLNPWKINWTWSSLMEDKITSAANIATVTTFQTKGRNSFCTGACVKKGSTIPSTVGNVVLPACGDGYVSAGEDCDIADLTGLSAGSTARPGCGLNCRYNGSGETTCGNGIREHSLGEACDPRDPMTKIGCSSICTHLGSTPPSAQGQGGNSSICGTGSVSSGEDCDLGITAGVLVVSSSLGCSTQCLHLGTRLTSGWCAAHIIDHGGFTTAQYLGACKTAYSQCGNGVSEPDEDANCEITDSTDPNYGKGKHRSWCNDYCLVNNENYPKSGCSTADAEGCDANGQYLGASLSYSIPSVCGDAVVGIGEDATCDRELDLVITHADYIDPWALAVGVGKGISSGNPMAQRADITAATVVTTTVPNRVITGSGQFVIACGYNTDSECQEINSNYGVGADSCCYARPQLVLPTTPPSNASGVCINTAIRVNFDRAIDPATVPGNFIIARGSVVACATSTDEVGALFAFAPGENRLPWFRNALNGFFAFVRSIFGESVLAVIPPTPTHWCKGDDLGTATVVSGLTVTSTSHLTVALVKPLASSTNYAIILKSGIKDANGVSIGQTAGGKDISWKFDTRETKCLVDTVSVDPPQWYFSKANATTTLTAFAHAAGTGDGVSIQSLPGYYSWDYLWAPQDNEFVGVSTTRGDSVVVTSKNRNGEVSVRASANIIDDVEGKTKGVVASDSSQIVVFLCENPWPPKEVFIQGGANRGPFTIFPYEDKFGNNDGFDFAADAFTNIAIPPSAVIDSPARGDGYFNFSTYYCADGTGAGSTLPYLRPAVQTSLVDLDVQYLPLKRFIFTNKKNADAIGIQVFGNPNHLSPLQWYKQDKALGGQGFGGSVHITSVGRSDDAVTDGNNVYVRALNYSASTKGLYDIIYSLSINSGAKDETRQVFDALVKNLKFNTNLTANDGYCGTTMDTPDYTIKCESDLQCPSGKVCASQVNKLRRGYTRLLDLKTIDSALVAYASARLATANASLPLYPDLKEGTYLSGQTLSVWSSWSVLGNAVGGPLPIDPINRLGLAGTCTPITTPPDTADVHCARGECNTFCTVDAQCGVGKKCTLHDDPGTNIMTTGWSTEDRRFSFACATSSYAYRYQLSATNGFALRSNIEDIGVSVNNLTDFLAGFSFSNQNRYNGLGFNSVGGGTGICNRDQEISTISVGTCGDGQINVNQGEQCDPPGSQDFGACLNGSVAVRACTRGATVAAGGCQWVASSTAWTWVGVGTPVSGAIPCSSSLLTKCGNGRVEAGETCDDGVLNGRWNKCTRQCAWPPTSPDPGYCGDGVSQPAHEVCDTGHREDFCTDTTTQITNEPVCKTICKKQCQRNGSYIENSHTCVSASDCADYLTPFQQALQPWYTPISTATNIAIPSNTIVITGGRESFQVSGIHFLSGTSYCNFSVKPYTCPISYNYIGTVGGCSAYIHAYTKVSFDPSTCANGMCPTSNSNTSVRLLSRSPASCTDSPTLGQVTIRLPSFSFRQLSMQCAEPPIETNCQETAQRCTDPSVEYVTNHQCSSRIVGSGQPTYDLKKENSCAWDCQNYGPYCGDGIVQPEYGESCDGWLSCQLSGTAGTKTCNSKCQINDPIAVGWWKLQAPSASGVSFEDASGSGNTGTCGSDTCPEFVAQGGVTGDLGAFAFNYGQKITVQHSQNLMPTSSLSIEAWIKPTSSHGNHVVVRKGAFTRENNNGVVRFKLEGGYNLEFNTNADQKIMFSIWDKKSVADSSIPLGGTSGYYPVSSDASTSLNRWTYVVATYDWKGGRETMSIYLDGQLDSSITRDASIPHLVQNSLPLIIGSDNNSINSEEFFTGSLNNIKILNRVLQSDEVKDRYENSWPCSIPPRTSATTVAAAAVICGNGVVDTNEACDRGTANNGIVCSPSYGRACTYCSVDCRNSINVQPTAYCGNGIVEGSEVCDADAAGVVYAKSTTTPATTLSIASTTHNGYPVLACVDEPSVENVFKKGTKTCANNCTAIVLKETSQAGCVRCGINTDSGVIVKGKLLNVLEVANASTSQNPLYVTAAHSGKIILAGLPEPTSTGELGIARVIQTYFQPIDLGDFVYEGPPKDKYTLQFQSNGQDTEAKLATDSLCYAGDSGRNYKLTVNDSPDPFLFPIKAVPTASQYDLILSPVISAVGLKDQSTPPSGSARPYDIRLVVSWVGDTAFNSGFVKPISGSPTIESLGFKQPPTSGFNYYVNLQYNNPATSVWNIWYHGRGQTPGLLSEESFTVDTAAMPSDTYVFYVRTQDGSTIKNIGRGAKLRVDVYLPVSPTSAPDYFTFSQPAKSFQFVLADPSANPGASYWEVLKIQKGPGNVADRIENVTTILNNGRIVTEPAQF